MVMSQPSALSKDDAIIQYRLLDWFAKHMVRSSKAFDGDLQMAAIFVVVDLVHLKDILGNELNASLIRPQTNASRIADVLDLPRETVRRKLKILEGKGWIERDARGLYRVALPTEMSSFSQDNVESVRRLVGSLRDVV